MGECGTVAGASELSALAHEYRGAAPERADALCQSWGEQGAVTLYRAVGCEACAHTGYLGDHGL